MSYTCLHQSSGTVAVGDIRNGQVFLVEGAMKAIWECCRDTNNAFYDWYFCVRDDYDEAISEQFGSALEANCTVDSDSSRLFKVESFNKNTGLADIRFKVVQADYDAIVPEEGQPELGGLNYYEITGHCGMTEWSPLCKDVPLTLVVVEGEEPRFIPANKEATHIVHA